MGILYRGNECPSSCIFIPTVDILLTSDISPTITGTTPLLNPGDFFSINLDGVLYSSLGQEITINGTQWSFEVPVPLSPVVYEVVATLHSLTIGSHSDTTSDELRIYEIPTINSLVTASTTPTFTGTTPLLYPGDILWVGFFEELYYPSSLTEYMTITGTDWSLDAIVTESPLGISELEVRITPGNLALDGVYGLLAQLTVVTIPTVNFLTTSSTTPTLTGTGTAAPVPGSLFTVVIAGGVFGTGVVVYDDISGDWTYEHSGGDTVPILIGVWDVVATHTVDVTDFVDVTVDELTISPP
jgi:hypothetical protein